MQPVARIVALFVLACAEPAAEHAYAKELTAWARDASFDLAAPRACSFEVEHFAATRATCWAAKSQREQTPGSRMFPRVVIEVADYTNEHAASQRMATFERVPDALRGETRKTYPLRAGFRVGRRVLIVTTDAYAFEPDVRRVAGELASALGGTGVRCFGDCG